MNQCGTSSRRARLRAHDARQRLPSSGRTGRFPLVDLKVLSERGGVVEVVLRVGGRDERWVGEILRGFSALRPSVELQPAGCSCSIEFGVDQVVEARAYVPRPGPALDAIERLQAMRIGRTR